MKGQAFVVLRILTLAVHATVLSLSFFSLLSGSTKFMVVYGFLSRSINVMRETQSH